VTFCFHEKNSGSSDPLYINVMDWPIVPAPKSDDDPISIACGSVFEVNDQDGEFDFSF
jgi:hypothetical protein